MILFKFLTTTLLLISICNASPFPGFGDVVTGGVNIGKGIAKKIPDIIPSADSIFSAGKEILLGTPFNVAASIINQFCSLALSANATKSKITPDVTKMSLIYFAPNENVTIPLLQSNDLWLHQAFNNNWNLTLFITGWTTDLDKPDSTVDTMSEAYKARGETNFVVLDSARFVDTLYTWSAFNTEEIGEEVGKALAKLALIFPVEKMHVIGHSLGSHIAGAAGRSFYRETSKLLPRITGLDPANPCFNEGEALSGLQRGDAVFVDIIHTNSGVLGKKDPIGDVDFYPNGVSSLQPGCLVITCAHARSWELYAETLYPGSENNFEATKCNSLAALNTGRCPGRKIYMGINTPSDAKGNYFFSTNSEKPFGKKN